MVISCGLMSAQKITVKGVVKDASTGEPVFGASILEKGTTSGTITNLDGEFSFNVSSSNAVLVVRYVGYEPKEVPVAGQTNLVIQIKEDAVALGEVVAIGYATVKKSDATGSVTAIKPDALNKGLTTNAQDMLTGKIAGVNVINGGGTPGGGATIRIRGGSSLSASNDPLIVIDGLTMDNNGIKGVANLLSTINPNDIETFTVLKDASATAIYGSRASNGVIIITTKKGDKNSKPKVTYDGNMSVSAIGKTIDVMSGDEFRNYVVSLFGEGSTAAKALGTENTDWQKEIYQTAVGHDHNISITGGLKNMPYRVGLGYTNQDGIIKTSNFERYLLSVSVSPTFFDDHLKVNINAKGMLANNRYADTGVIGAAASFDPTKPVRSSEDVYQKFGGYWQWYQTSEKFGVIDNSLAGNNPVATLMQKDDRAKSNDILANADLDYTFHFLPELRAHLTLGMERAYGKQTTIKSVEGIGDYPFGNTGYEKKYKTNKLLTYYMQYAKEIGQNKFDIMGGYEWQRFYNDGNKAYDGIYTTINGIDGKTYTSSPSSLKWASENYLVSFFGRANYTFAGKYMLTATIRNDGSSRFSKENRWGLFPSAAFAWRIKDEDFLTDNNTFSDLKLRLGYGVTGQQDISSGDYPYLAVYTKSKTGGYYYMDVDGDGVYEDVSTYRPDAVNPNLKWEETTTWNGGLDFGFLNNRITGAIDYYYRVTNDLINKEVEVSAGTNFKNKVVSNIGSLINFGTEFSLNAKAIQKKNFSWDIGFNMTQNNNKITKLTTGTKENYRVEVEGISAGTGNNIEAHAVGYPAFSYFVYQQVYDNAGKPIEGLFVDRNGDGTINDDDRYYFHNPNPLVQFGLSSKIIYKKIDFGFAMHSNIGNYMYNDVAARSANIGKSGIFGTSGFLTNVQKSALETNFVGKTNWYFSDYYVQNASFLKIDNITVGYSFGKIGNVISGGRVSCAVQNVYTLTKYSGLDPEISKGIDKDMYPRPITTVLGLSLKF
jgi:iron complex outermembrane receptor protein